MNLKSYTRGIGAGLIVAALVLGVGNKTEKMTDAQIKARALELGMIEAQTLTQITGDSQKTDEESIEKADSSSEKGIDEKEEAAPEFKEPDAVTVDPILTEESSSETSEADSDDEQDNDDSSDETSTDESSENEPVIEEADDNGDSEEPPVINETPEGTVEIQIIRGDSSVTVSRKMYEAGLVESAVEFDKFLCQNGYDRYISVGTYTISFGASFEEMAKVITGK